MKRTAQLLLLISLFIISASQPLYAGGPWEGKIIDIETKEPLEDAVVVAVWYKGWLTQAGTVSYVYKVKEVVTDKNGKFKIPAYFPINFLPLLTHIKEPEFIIYKPGYGKLEMALGDYLTGNKDKTPYSGNMLFYDVKISPGVIELQRLKTRDERLRAMPGHIAGALDKSPLLNKLIDEEDKSLGIK